MSYNRVMVHAPTPPRSFRMPSIKDAVRTDLSGYIPVPPCGNDTDILQGDVEIDETFFGGKEANKHVAARAAEECTQWVNQHVIVKCSLVLLLTVQPTHHNGSGKRCSIGVACRSFS